MVKQTKFIKIQDVDCLKTLELCQNKNFYIFNLDNTLYDPKPKMWIEFGKNLVIKLNERNDRKFTLKDILGLYNNFGCSYAPCAEFYGLRKNDLDFIFETRIYNDFLEEDKELTNIFKNIKEPKLIMTNSCKLHVEKCLKALNMENLFDLVIYNDYFNQNKLCKPMLESFAAINNILKQKNPKNIFFFDDQEKNIKSAKKSGWKSYFVSDRASIKKILRNI